MSVLQIGQGKVHHHRAEGAKNSFNYPTYFIYFNCKQEEELRSVFRKNFYSTLSLESKDYLRGSTESIDSCVKNFLKTSCNYEADEVYLHTLPRVLGYAFNPVSFWFCFRQNTLDAVLVEVNNTFGERHFYWIHPGNTITSDTWYKAEKVFHVSPFFPVDGFYQFRFNLNKESIKVDINYHAPEGHLRLATAVEGDLTPLTHHSLLPLFFKYGWITLFVILRIHTQALRLWIKKQKFYTKPALPEKEISS